MNKAEITRPVWVEINLDNLAHNMREVRRVTKAGTLVTAVIKADGYGHGAVEIAETLLENGADRFAVATFTEAVQLKRAFPETEVMVLGYTPERYADEVVEASIIQTVYSLEQAKCFSQAAVAQNRTLKLHIKIDSGMRRIGMEPTLETVQEILEISKKPNLVVEGIFTHFAVADEVDKSFTYRQVEKFNFVCEELKKVGLDIPVKHVSNSAAIIDLPDLNMDMVRAGIMLYGLYPSPDVKKANVDLKEVMSLKAEISHVKTIEEGEGVSYGLKFKSPSQKRIASIAVGYADGFTRLYSFKAQGLVGGSKVPVVGRICMDQCMLDVTGLDVKRGDTVTLFGTADGNHISIDEVAEYISTINYEVVCMIGKRVPRVYVKNNEILKVRDAVLELR